MQLIDFRVRPPLKGLLGMVMYTDAARRDRFTGQLRFIFATAYPLVPLREYAQWFVQVPLKPQNLERCAYRNVAELLGIHP